MKSYNSKLLILASLIMGLGVILGAFGAHALKPLLSEYQTDIYKTAILYLFIHGIGLFIPLSFSSIISTRNAKIVFTFFFLGILLFSGSLLLLASRDILNIEHWKWLGPLTPIGGLLFVCGWFYLGFCFFKASRQS